MFGLLGDEAADVTILSSPDGTYADVSEACRRVLGWDPGQLVGRRPDEFVHPDDIELEREGRARAMGTADAVVTRCRLRCADGGYLWTESAIRAVPDPGPGEEMMLVATVRDITDRKTAETKLERQALTDPLTGIANRTVFMDRLGQALRRLERAPRVVAVIYFDLDRFKVVNDSLGHRIGDELLVKVAERTLRSLRPSDTLARLGGDEFVVLAEGLDAHPEAVLLAERICAAMEEPFDLHGESFVCTVSAGVATTTKADHAPEMLLQEADLALYRAKDGGRNRVAVFDEELRSTAVGRLGTEQMLRLALAGDRLVVHFQPIFDLAGGGVMGAEALVRVRVGKDLVTAESFIAVAEETGMVASIDAHVLARASDQMVSWRREFGPEAIAQVSVNVSARQLADTRFVDAVEEALVRASLPGIALSLEMNERVLVDATSSAMTSLRAIRSLGVGIGLDDFGTGFSSLAQLRQLPLDFVKIDRSFVHELGRSTQDAAVVAGVIDLCHALGLSVVAEGVETAHQHRILTELGCDRAQGFLFGHAADPKAFSKLIAQRQAGTPAAIAHDRSGSVER